MAAFVLRDAEMRYGGYDITGLLNSITMNYGVDIQDGTVFNPGISRIRVTGMKDTTVQVNGFFGDDGSDKPLFDAVGALTPSPFSAVPLGGAVGDRAFFLDAHKATFSPGGAIGELMQFSGEIQANGPLIQGTILESAIITSSGNSTGFQLGALSATERMYALMHVVAASDAGGETLDMIIQSDDNAGFSTPTTRISFSQFSTTVGAEVLFVQGAITDDYWRASWTIAGATPSFTVFVAIGKLS